MTNWGLGSRKTKIKIRRIRQKTRKKTVNSHKDIINTGKGGVGGPGLSLGHFCILIGPEAPFFQKIENSGFLGFLGPKQGSGDSKIESGDVLWGSFIGWLTSFA